MVYDNHKEDLTGKPTDLILQGLEVTFAEVDWQVRPIVVPIWKSNINCQLLPSVPSGITLQNVSPLSSLHSRYDEIQNEHKKY